MTTSHIGERETRLARAKQKFPNLTNYLDFFNVEPNFGHAGYVNCVASTSNGHLISGSDDQTLKVWQIKTGECLYTLQGHAGGVSSLAIMPNGLVISGSKDKTLKVWQLDTKECIQTLHGHLEEVICLTITFDGHYIISGSRDGTIKVWRIDNYECVHTLRGHTNAVECVIISPDGKYIISGSLDQSIKIWDFVNGTCIRTIQEIKDFKGFEFITSMSITPDGTNIIYSTGNTTLKIMNLKTGELVQTLSGHSGVVSCLLTSPDGKLIISGSADKTIKIWSTKTLECIRTITGHINSVKTMAFTNEGELISGSYDYSIKLWRLNTGECITTLSGHSGVIKNMIFTPDGEFVISDSRENGLNIWRISNGELIDTLNGCPDSLRCLAITPEGKYITAGFGSGELNVWHFPSKKCIGSLKDFSAVNKIAISPDGTYIVAGFRDAYITIWNLKKSDYGPRTYIIKTEFESAQNFVFSSNRELIIMGSRNQGIEVYKENIEYFISNSGNPNPLRKWSINIINFTGHTEGIQSIAICPDQQTIISGSMDYTLKVWSLKTNNCIHTLQGHSNSVYQVEISRNGQFIVSASLDGTIKVWQLSSGLCVQTFFIGRCKITIHPSGDKIFVADQLGNFFNFPISVDASPSKANQQITRRFTRILFLGEGAAGKTTLINRMTQNKFIPLTENDATFALEVTPYHITEPNVDKTSLAVSFFDFGGQSFFRWTHQAFLDSHVKIVVVLDGRQHNGAPVYWLKKVQQFAPNATTCIVTSKADMSVYFGRNKLTEMYSLMQRTFPLIHLEGPFETDASTGKGIDEFREFLHKNIIDDKGMLITCPASWIDLESRILKVGHTRSIWSLSDFTASLYSDIGNDKELRASMSGLKSILENLNQSGVLYYRSDPRLAWAIITNIDLINKSMALVIKLAQEHDGRLHADTLEKELTTYSPFIQIKEKLPEISSVISEFLNPYIMPLLENLRLCFRDHYGGLLFPELLPELPISPDNIKQIKEGRSPKGLSFPINAEYMFKDDVLGVYAGIICLISSKYPSTQIGRNYAEFYSNLQSAEESENISPNTQGSQIIIVREENIEGTKLFLHVAGTPDSRTILSFIDESILAAAKSWNLNPTILAFKGCDKCGLKIPQILVEDNLKEGITQRKCKGCGTKINLDENIETDTTLDLSHQETYQLFISYCRRQNKLVEEVIKELRKNPKYKNALWWDQERVVIGQDLQTAIILGIRTSRRYLVLLSHDYLKSEFCRFELTSIFNHGRTGSIIPINYKVLNDELKQQNAWPNLSNLVYLEWSSASDIAEKIIELLESLA